MVFSIVDFEDCDAFSAITLWLFLGQVGNTPRFSWHFSPNMWCAHVHDADYNIPLYMFFFLLIQYRMITGCHSVTKGPVPGKLPDPKVILNSARDIWCGQKVLLSFPACKEVWLKAQVLPSQCNQYRLEDNPTF